MGEPLQNLNLKWWHTVLVAASFTVFMTSLTIKLEISTNTIMAYLSSGTFFISLGFFACQTFRQAVSREPGFSGIFTQEIIRPNLFGIVLMFVGAYLLYKGLM